MKCQYCGRDEALPFKCQYCQSFFCIEHRLPENHACPEGWRARALSEEAPQPIKGGKTAYDYTVTYRPSGFKPKRFWFSQTEIRHLTISTLLVMGVGLSWVLLLALEGRWNLPTEILLFMGFIFTCVFLSHEIAHKIVAQHYGFWAEFRLTLFGALVTLLSIFSPFKIVSPGAVMIAGASSKGTVGKISIAGPLTNIIFCATSFAFTLLLAQFSYFFVVAVFIAAFNAFIAIINLIPIGILDGRKIFDWNKIVWAAAFSSSVALTIGIFALYSALLL